MICPKCGNDNLSGKILCYKCGAKLLPDPEKASQRRKKSRQGKKKGFTGIFFLLLFIFLGVAFYLIIQNPNIEPLETSLQAARSLEAKLERIDEAGSERKPVKVEITQEELNSLITERLKEMKTGEDSSVQRNVELDDIQVRFEGKKLKNVITVKVKGKPIYVSLTEKVSVVDGRLVLEPDEAKIGKLPLPVRIVQQAMKPVEKERKTLSSLDLPPGMRDVRIEGGKLVLEAGPAEEIIAPVKKGEITPPPKKRVLTAEERAKIKKRRKENEANVWIQLGNNFADVKRYKLALEYYQKVMDKYPESAQAQEARERIKEIKAKSESE